MKIASTKIVLRDIMSLLVTTATNKGGKSNALSQRGKEGFEFILIVYDAILCIKYITHEFIPCLLEYEAN